MQPADARTDGVGRSSAGGLRSSPTGSEWLPTGDREGSPCHSPTRWQLHTTRCRAGGLRSSPTGSKLVPARDREGSPCHSPTRWHCTQPAAKRMVHGSPTPWQLRTTRNGANVSAQLTDTHARRTKRQLDPAPPSRDEPPPVTHQQPPLTQRNRYSPARRQPSSPCCLRARLRRTGGATPPASPRAVLRLLHCPGRAS